MKKVKILSTISSLSLLSSLGLASCSCNNSKTNTSQVHISIMSDIHGEIPGYGDDFFNSAPTYAGAIRTIQEIQSIHKNYPGSISLLCGDMNGSGTFSTCTKGDTMYPVLSAMNCPYSAVGNHAWDFGSGKLPLFDQLGRTKDTVGKYFVTSNVLDDRSLQTHQWVYKKDQVGFDTDYALWKQHKVSWADPYKVIDMNGHKVALIGLTTKGALEDSAKTETKTLSFIDYEPAIYYTKYLMQEDLGNTYNQIDAFVALTHVEVGYNNQGQLHGGAVDICKNIDTRIDLFLAGHWHGGVADYVHNDKLNKDIPIVQSAAHMVSFCDATITFDDSKPAGQRLKDIKVKDIRPTIDYDGYDPKTQPELAKKAAEKQIKKIIANPVNDIVSKTAIAYSEQKNIAKQTLDNTLNTSVNGLKYDIFEHWDHKYGSTPVEQTGYYVAKSNPVGLSILHSSDIEKGDIVKPSIGIISNDSIRGTVPQGDVKLKDVYNIYAFDNKPVYFSLTYFQLEQVVKYLLAGCVKDGNIAPSNDYYTEDLYYEPGKKVPYEDIGDISFTYCPAQFAGFAFNVDKHAKQDGSITYTYVDGSLKVYDPSIDNANIDDIDNYKDKAYWTAKEANGEFITGVMSNFNFNDGNKQFKMIKRFALYNDQTCADKYKIHLLDDDVRHCVVSTMLHDKSLAKSVDVSIGILNKLMVGF